MNAAPGRAKWTIEAIGRAAIRNGIRCCRARRQGRSATGLSGARPMPGPLPANDEDIAFAPLTQLSRWIETRKLTSERLTDIYLDRLERFDPKLRCVITLTRDLALAQAQAGRSGDRGRANTAGRCTASRGARRIWWIPRASRPLTAPSLTATACQTQDAAVVKRLHDAGAVLVAKLSLGALALNDIWFGGQTMNPWLLEEGASGSSAGPGAATAAGLVGFSIGSETGGSIVSPVDALRHHRTAAHLRPRAAHRRDDAVLVAGQAGPHDARRGRRDARAAGDLRAGCGRPVRACPASSTSTPALR